MQHVDLLDQRLNAIIRGEVKNIEEYGDRYFNSGTGLFGKLGQELGDSGRGRRAVLEAIKANRDMGGDYSNNEILEMFNDKLTETFPDDDTYRISTSVLPKVRKAKGELVGGQTEIAKAAPPFDEITGEDFAKLREQKQEGGEIDEQMSVLMQPKEDMPPVEQNEEMIPDEKMEDNYIDFILDEALNEEEENMLMSKLEQDEQLSMLFDKVIEVASEFAGSGPVEGPGSGVSDSIPARLSDGEFVFTAKAVEEIGADELMRMMKDAEMIADKRQQMQNGGNVEEEIVTMQPNQEPARQEIRVVKETVDSPSRMMVDEDEISKSIKSNMMLDPTQRHVRS